MTSPSKDSAMLSLPQGPHPPGTLMSTPGLASSQDIAGGRPVNGAHYTVTSTIKVQAPAGSESVLHWSGSGRWTAKRGRVEITTSDTPQVMAPGAYFLFDSTDVVLVDSLQRTCQAIRVAPPVDSQPVTMSDSDHSHAVFDTAADTPIISGYATRHYRLTVSSDLSQARLGRLQKGTDGASTELTIDYWVAQTDILPEDPLPLGLIPTLENLPPSATLGDLGHLRRNSLQGGSWLRMVVRTVTKVGMLEVLSTTEVQISDVRSAHVDEGTLVLPPDVRLVPSSSGQTPVDHQTPHGEEEWLRKWRVLP